MNKETKTKIIAGIIATSGLAGGFMLSDKQNCDHTIIYQGDEICITKEQRQAIDEQLRATASSGGFGGIKFGN